MGNTLLAASVATVPGKLRYPVPVLLLRSGTVLLVVALYQVSRSLRARNKYKSKILLRLILLPSCIPIAEFYTLKAL